MVFRLGPWKDVTSEVNSLLCGSQAVPLDVNMKNWKTLSVAAGAGMPDVFDPPRWHHAKLRGDYSVRNFSNDALFAGNAGRSRDVVVCCCFSKKDPAAVRVAAITDNCSSRSLAYLLNDQHER